MSEEQVSSEPAEEAAQTESAAKATGAETTSSEVDSSETSETSATEESDDDVQSEPAEEAAVSDVRDIRIRLLEKQLSESDARLRDYIKAHKRAQAEFEELKKRLERDQAARIAEATVALFEQLLPVADNLERSLEASRGEGAEDVLREGVEMVNRLFYQALESLGLERFDPIGEAFDPECMEALGVIPVEDATQDGKVVFTLKAGFRAGDKELRPALVQVGRAS